VSAPAGPTTACRGAASRSGNSLARTRQPTRSGRALSAERSGPHDVRQRLRPRRAMPHLSSVLWPGAALRAKGCDWLAFGIGKAEPDEIEAYPAEGKIKRNRHRVLDQPCIQCRARITGFSDGARLRRWSRSVPQSRPVAFHAVLAAAEADGDVCVGPCSIPVRSETSDAPGRKQRRLRADVRGTPRAKQEAQSAARALPAGNKREPRIHTRACG
jgi:hypothetical protein